MATETFKAEAIYSAITLNDLKLSYKADSKLAGQYYYIGRWGNRGFTVSQKFYEDFRNRNIAQLTIQESSYPVKDVATGQEVMRDSATIMGYDTFDGQINLQDKLGQLEVAVAKRSIVVKHAQKVALAELKITKADLELLEELA